MRMVVCKLYASEVYSLYGKLRFQTTIRIFVDESSPVLGIRLKMQWMLDTPSGETWRLL